MQCVHPGTFTSVRSVPLILSFHLRTLRDAGLVSDRKEGRWVHYALNEEALGEAKAYVTRLARDAKRGAGFQCCRHARN